jgi:hypothetical protein
MNARAWIAGTALIAGTAALTSGSAQEKRRMLKAEKVGEESVRVITADGQPVLRYMIGKLPAGEAAPSVESSCYFHPIHTPSGEVVTDMAPADHPHHRGVFLGWVQVTGKKPADFWGWGAKAPKEARRVVNRGVRMDNGDHRAGFVAENEWLVEGEAMAAERCAVRVAQQGPANIIDVEYRVTPAEGEIRIEPNPFGGFCYRARPRGKVEMTGPDGPVAAADAIFDRPASNWPAARWYDATYRGEGGKVSGVAVMDHPSNPTTTWHGHRGLHMLNPCIVANGPVTVSRNKPLVLRYRLVAHDGDAAAANLPALYRQFAAR